MTQLANVFEVPLTMSSVEIAELTGKRHDNVMRKAKELAEKGIIRSPQIEETDSQNKKRLCAPDFSGTQVYGVNNKREAFNLPKRECLV